MSGSYSTLPTGQTITIGVAASTDLPSNPPNGLTYYVVADTSFYRYSVSAGIWQQVQTSGTPAAHNSLTSIQGGTTAQYYHLNATDYGNIANVAAQLSALHTTGSPEFAGMTLTSFNGVVQATAGVLSASTLAHSSLGSIAGSANGYHLSSTIYGNLTAATAQTANLKTDTTPTFAGIVLGTLTGVVTASTGTITATATPTVTAITTSQFISNGGQKRKFHTYTADQTLDSTNDVVFANKATAIIFSLPDATTHVNRVYTIKNINIGALTITPAGSDTIDGAASKIIAVQNASCNIISSGTDWKVF